MTDERAVDDASQPAWRETYSFRDEEVGSFRVFTTRPKVKSGVPIGDGRFILPRKFTILARDTRIPSIDVQVSAGAPEVIALRQRIGGPPLRTSTLRFPLDRYVTAAVQRLAVEPTGRSVTRDRLRSSVPGSSGERALNAALAGRRRRTLDDAFFRNVAAIYRGAIATGTPPTLAVAKGLHGSRPSAGRWVARARKEGFLGPAAPRRPGEIEKGSKRPRRVHE